MLTAVSAGKTVFEKKYQAVRPPEMERVVIDLSKADIVGTSLVFQLGEVQS